MKIPFFTLSRIPQLIQNDIEQAVIKVLRSGELSHGRNAAIFEANWAEVTNYRYCALLSSGTDALLALALYRKEKYGLGKVVCPALTFIASAAPFALLKNEIVFADVDDSGCLAVEQLSNCKISAKDLILPVSLYGNIVELKKIREIYPDSYIAHDSSQCAGGNLNGYNFANYTDAECQSFYITKNLGGITEGGCLLTNDVELYTFVTSIRNHGRAGNNYEFERLGLNLRNNEINAAILNSKLPYLYQWNDERIVAANQYKRNLSNCKNIKFLTVNSDNKNVYHLMPILTKPSQRNNIRAELEKRGIATGIHYSPCLCEQKAFRDKFSTFGYANAKRIADSVITLPIFTGILEQEIDYVCENLIEITEMFQ